MNTISAIKNTIAAARKMNWMSKAPYMYRRAAEKLVYKIITGRNKFRDIIIQTNVNCTARCVGCSVQHIEKRKDTLSLEEIDGIIDAVRSVGAHAVILTGGEPTLYPHMADVVRYATLKSMTTHSSTNGISVTKEILNSLKAARLTTLAFNFWGIGDRHDQEVGVVGAYAKLLENFKYSISIGLSYFMNHVTTRNALQSGDTFRLMDLAFELGCRGITLVDPCAYDESSDFLLTAKEFTLINDTVREKGIASRVNKCANRLWTAPSCGAASERIFVTAFGDVCPCDYIPISFGNMRMEPLKEIMKRMQSFSDHFTCAGCIAGRSKIFVEKYIAPIYQSGEVPLHYLKHPMFKKSTGAT